MSFTLRPYQENFISQISRSLAINSKTIACLPTGGGKSKVMISIARRAAEKGRAVIVITEATKIFDQLQTEAGGEYVSAGIKHLTIKNGHVYTAMCQTLIRRPVIINQINTLSPTPLIIADECHIGTLTRLLTELNGCMTIGFTATPLGKHLPVLYKDCVVGAQVDDLIQDGFLCTYRHFIRTKANLSQLEVQAGEFTDESQKEAFQTTAVFDGLIDDLRNAEFNKCMIFTPNIDACERTTLELISHGFAVSQYHSRIAAPAYEMAKFEQLNVTNILVSVAGLTKGYDYPSVDLIILQLATKSLPKYLQMCGRGSRPIPGKKSFFTVIDYGENGLRHGYWFQDRPWDTMWNDVKKRKRTDKEGAAPVKLCPKCECMIPILATVCEYCGELLPRVEKEMEQGELVDLTENYHKLNGKLVSQLLPDELAMFAKTKNKRQYAIRVARAMEQINLGYLGRFANAMGYKPAWVERQVSELPKEKIEFYDIRVR